MKTKSNVKGQLNKADKKHSTTKSKLRIGIIAFAIAVGVLGMTFLLSIGKSPLALFVSAADEYKVEANLSKKSLDGVDAGNIIPGRDNEGRAMTQADEGDSISLYVTKAAVDFSDFLILYTTEPSISPKLTRMVSGYQDLETIASIGDASKVSFYFSKHIAVIKDTSRNYIGFKISGAPVDAPQYTWCYYRSGVEVWDCSKSTNAPIEVPDTIRTQGSFKINTLMVKSTDTNESGSNGRGISTLSFDYFPRQYVEKIQATYAGSAVTENVEQVVDMATSIRVSPVSNTVSSRVRYFYTLDGSLPQYQFNASSKVPEPASDMTKVFTNTGGTISITPEIANFGESFTLRITGVELDLNQNPIRVERSQTYLFKVNEEDTIPAITAYPTSTDATMPEVKKGDNIKLYVGKYTIDTATGSITPAEDQTKYTIYYTIDGSEPALSSTGELQGTTMQYTGTGIVVPAPTGNLFTIRAMASNGKWSYSAISNFSYTYPSAINSPYATPSEGNVSLNTKIQLKCSTEDAKIFYTISTDGSEPKDPTSDDALYTDDTSILITGPTIIKAIAQKDGMNSTVAIFKYGVLDTLSAPTASIASGSVVPPGTTLTLKAADGATIHYTTDGSSPLDPENTMVAIGNVVPLNGDVGTMITVKAYASKEDYTDSPLAMFVYTISNYAGGIYADIEDGSTVKNGDIVTLNTDVSDATIYYTIDGSNPTTSSNQGSKVTISGEPGEKVVLKAIAVAGGSTRTTATATFSYTIMKKLKSPQSNVPDGAVFTVDSQVALSVEDGNIYYTTDGSEPSTSSMMYSNPIEVTKDVVIKAIAVSEDQDDSDVATYSYTFADKVLTPTVSEENGELELGTQVIFSCKTKNVTMYYTTNGTDPNIKDKNSLNVYTGPITVNKAMTIKLIATKENMQSSDIVTARYTVREPVEVISAEETGNSFVQDTSGRLVSRHTYSGADSGPSYSDLVLRNINYGAVLSANAGVVQDGAQLVLSTVQSSQTSVNLVKQLVDESYNIVQSYDVSLVVDGIEVNPDGEVELGLAIPSEFENAIIKVIQLQEDGTIQVYETRRSNGTAYANIDKMGVFAIIAPIDQKDESNVALIRNMIIAGAVFLICAGGGMFAYSRRRKKESDLSE